MFASCLFSSVAAQINTEKFGKGIQFMSKDSSSFMKMNFRFQNLMSNTWQATDGTLTDVETKMLIRRSRLKFGGYAVSPKLRYKVELGLSNRDIGGGSSSEFSTTANLILDAWVAWDFYKNFTIQFGQSKLPGSRERIISSADLQFVDRSLLNSRYNIDRDFGWQLKHHFTIGSKFIVKETFAFSQGEGRNVTAGNFDGSDFTFKLEFLPFGAFQKKGEYIGSAIKYEKSPKLAVGISYDHNQNAVRTRGQLGSFIKDSEGNYLGNTLNTTFIDLMFKYQNWSLMTEYAQKSTGDKSPFVIDTQGDLVGTFFTGTGYNIQAGYLFNSKWEVAGRYTTISPTEGVASDIVQYTLGINKFIVGHKVKVQTDFTYIAVASSTDEFVWRTQVEFQF